MFQAAVLLRVITETVTNNASVVDYVHRIFPSRLLEEGAVVANNTEEQVNLKFTGPCIILIVE
jgi:hypothetical protein